MTRRSPDPTAGAREAHRRKCEHDRAALKTFLYSQGYWDLDEYLAAKQEELMGRGKPQAQFSAAAYREGKR